MAVLLRSEIDSLPIGLDHIQQTAEKLLDFLSLTDRELSILLVSDERIAELNATYRHKNTATNVLSFPMFDDDSPSPTILLGDIVISIDTAIRESSEKNISLDNYLAILQVHGLAHLLGYDHERDEKAAKEMLSFEKKLLAQLNPEFKNPLTN